MSGAMSRRHAATLRATLSAAFVVAAGLLHAGLAAADDKAVADALFEEGLKLSKSGHFAGACEKFKASQSLDPGAGTLLNLGDCHEKQNKLATAWAYYNEAVSFATQQGARAKADLATQLRDAVAPRLSHITVQVGSDARVDGLQIELSGSKVLPATFGTALPFDGGEHTLVARAPGYEAWTATIRLEPERDQETITVPVLKAAASTAAEAPPADPAQEAAPSEPVEEAASVDDGSTQRIVGFVVGGVGIAATGVGLAVGATVFGDVDRLNTDSSLCDANKQCTPEGDKVRSDAETKALIANIAVPTGLAALAVGIYLVVTAGPDEEAPPAAARVQPWLGPSLVGLGYSGQF